MKIIFIVDSLDSALFTSASQWCQTVGGKVYAATQFRTFKQLLSQLVQLQPDLIFFSWRQVLDLAFLSKSNLELLKVLRSTCRVLALVADHTADASDRLAKDFQLVRAGLGLVTVSERLQDFYTSVGLVTLGVLPDRPNCELIREVRSQNVARRPNSVIWVGNSKWGKYQGYSDHKGLNTKFRPFLDLAKKNGIHVDSVILDSSEGKVSQREVILELASSELLLITSASEGSCLPILEALGVGTNVISTDVGIANLVSTVRVLPANSSPEIILQTFIEWRQSKTSPHEVIIDFENYIDSMDNSWDKLLHKTNKLEVQFDSIHSLLEDGVCRVFKLFHWNVKFYVKWRRLRNAK
jgi:hypothetical protein